MQKKIARFFLPSIKDICRTSTYSTNNSNALPLQTPLCALSIPHHPFATLPDTSTPTSSPPLFSKILVANRGEIAVRIMKTAKKLGIPTVAVYSNADQTALHTRTADEAVHIGPSPSTQSYLNTSAILDAMHKTGADAVHPGYGFLSENAEFANAVAAAGMTFIGPPASAVHAMGDKVESKRFAHAAGVNTIPGWVGVVENVDHAVSVANDIGFPVMVKASAGGGGKGMRIAWDEKDLIEGYKLACQEAASAFGDSRMLIEKFIQQPRHVEIQVLGDRHGNVLYLPERECSIQRRNQKVIEEAPCPIATPELREAMGMQAVSLCKAVGYYSAGTCEFLVDVDKKFYFLEMNTRLQVEHPITESITGLDLVEQMLLIAANKPLSISQEDIKHPRGWAIECRVYAEDPARGFLPSIGKLKRYIEPHGHGIRVDSGVEEGSEISVHYDPMISKVIGTGPDRAIALKQACIALDRYVIRGVQHNAPLLRSVLDAEDFRAGKISTAFLAEHFPRPDSSAPQNLTLSRKCEEEVVGLAAALKVWQDLWHAVDAVRYNAVLGKERKLAVTSMDGDRHRVTVHGDGVNAQSVEVTVRPASLSTAFPTTSTTTKTNGRNNFALGFRVSSHHALYPPLEVEIPHKRILQIAARPEQCVTNAGTPLISIDIDGQEAIFQIISQDARRYTLQYRGAQRTLAVDTPCAAGVQHLMPPPRKEDRSKVVLSPMPGTVVSIAVKMGDEVREGDEIAVVEAMKMQNVLRAGSSGKVVKVECVPGSSVSADEVLVRLE